MTLRSPVCVLSFCSLIALPGASPALAQAVTTAPQASTPAGAANQKDDDAEGVPHLFFDVDVTAASRTIEETARTPQAVSVATRDEVERRQPRTPNQMLSEEPGVWSVQVTSQGSPIIRGLIGNRV